MKKFIVMMLALILTANTVFAAEIYKDEYKEKDEVISVITDLGIIDEDDVDGHEEDILTRGQVAKIVYNLANYQNRGEAPAADRTYFTDVDMYHYSAGYVQYLAENGFVKGYEDGTFRPDETVSVDTAARMLLRAGGYGICEEFGHTDIGTYVAKVKKGVTGDLTYENAAEMVYNLLFMNSISLKFTSGTQTYEESEIVLKKLLDIDYIDGAIEAIAGFTLYGDKTGENKVIVDGKELWTEDTYSADMLGMYARVYFDADDNIATIALLANTVMTIAADDVVDFADNKLTYELEGSRKKTANIAADKDIMYNGYMVESISDYLPENGTIKLIDRNSDGSYDVVIIEEYQSYVVKSAGEKSEMITTKNVGDDGVSIVTIKLDDYDDVEIFNEAGKSVSLKTVSENAVIMVYTFGTKYMKIVVVNNKVTGAVSKIYTDEGVTYVVIDETEYELYGNYYSNAEIGVGTNVTLFLDANNKVSGVQCGVTEGWKVGYVIDVKFTDNEQGDDAVRLKLCNQNGNVEKLFTTAKVRVDGAKKNASEAYTAIMTAFNNLSATVTINGKEDENYTTRLIRYYQTEEGISKIDLPTVHGLYEETRPTNFDSENQLLLQTKGKFYSENNKVLNNISVEAGRTVLPGEVYMHSESIIFNIPASDEKLGEDDGYSVTKYSNVSNFGYSNIYVSGYTINNEQLTIDYAVMRRSAGVNSELNMSVVKTITQTVNEDNEAVAEVELSNGSTYPVSDKTTVSGNDIKRGDVIAYKVSEDELVIEEILCRENGGYLNKTKYFYGNAYINNNGTGRMALGTVGKMAGEYVNINFEGSTVGEIAKLPSAMVCVEYGVGKPQIYTVNASDVRKGDKLIVFHKQATQRAVILIKESH